MRIKGNSKLGCVKGKHTDRPQLPRKDGSTSHIATSQVPVFHSDITDFQRIDEKLIDEMKVKSFAGIPLVARNETVGVLYLNYCEPYIFTEDEQTIIKLLANQASVAISNATLLDATAQNNYRLQAMQDIGLKLTSNTKLDDVLGLISKYAINLANADFATVFVFDADKEEFEIGMRKGDYIDPPQLPRKDGSTAYIATSQVPVFYSDITDFQRIDKKLIDEMEVKSFAGIPLVARNETVGVLYLNYCKPYIFSENETDNNKIVSKPSICSNKQCEVAIKSVRTSQCTKRGEY